MTTGTERSAGASAAALAGGIGAVVACCLVELLVAVGVVTGVGGAAKGGIAAVAGVSVALIVWLTALLVRRHRTRQAAGCCRPAGDEPDSHSSTVDDRGR